MHHYNSLFGTVTVIVNEIFCMSHPLADLVDTRHATALTLVVLLMMNMMIIWYRAACMQPPAALLDGVCCLSVR